MSSGRGVGAGGDGVDEAREEVAPALVVADAPWLRELKMSKPEQRRFAALDLVQLDLDPARRGFDRVGAAGVKDVRERLDVGVHVHRLLRRGRRHDDPERSAATLQELLWGPSPGDPPHLMTALPTPKDVLDYAGRRADWGDRVQLRRVRIVEAEATADFSREFGAYGGGSLRVSMIDQQITRTLEQFSSVRQVQIAIEGEIGGVLEP